MTDKEVLARAMAIAMGPEHGLVERIAAELRKHDDERYKLSWQVRDTCARAEAAEATITELRKAVRQADPAKKAARKRQRKARLITKGRP